MRISGVNLEGSLEFLHDAVYGSMDVDSYIKRGLVSPPDFVEEALVFDHSNLHIRKTATRVVLLNARYQSFLGQMEARPDLDDSVRALIPRMRSCLPAGVFFPEKKRALYCRQYAVCPWCRFRKAVEIADKLLALKAEAKQMAFLTITTPAALLSLAPDTAKKDHDALIRILCKTKKLFLGDQVVTVPNWYSTGRVDDQGKTVWAMSFNTTIIGLMKDRGTLPLPEECLSEERRARMIQGGIGCGTWSVYRLVIKMIKAAFRCSMGYSPSLVAHHLDSCDYQKCVGLQSEFRSVGHGAMRG